MQIIDIFSGVGGFSIAGHQLGWETILFCEKELFPQMVLRERFPGVPIFDDVCKLTGETINGLIQSNRPIILTGGFPCQPFSVAGAREGTEDSRHLWPEMFRIIQSVRPDYIIGENVPGLLSIEGGMVFEQVCLDLESEGYEVQAFVLPACATGAPHRRDRVWIVAHSNEVRRGSGSGSVSKENGEVPQWNENAEFSDTNSGIVGYSKEAKQQRSGSSRTRGIGLADTNSGTTPNTQQIGHRGRSNENGIGTEREIHKDFGHNGDGIRSEIEGCCKCTSENSWSSGCENGEHDQQGNIGDFGKPGTGSKEWDIVNANGGNYWHDWPSISPFHSGHDGLPPELVRHIRTNLAEAGETEENIEAYIRKEANWIRKQAIMAAGNAVVPTVVLQIMKAIQYHYDLPRPNPINHIRTQTE